MFNVGSRQQIAERLAGKGAVWKELTPAGKPKVDEATLKKQTHIPEAKIILRYLLCQKRASHVDSWIKAVGEDGENTWTSTTHRSGHRTHGALHPEHGSDTCCKG